MSELDAGKSQPGEPVAQESQGAADGGGELGNGVEPEDTNQSSPVHQRTLEKVHVFPSSAGPLSAARAHKGDMVHSQVLR